MYKRLLLSIFLISLIALSSCVIPAARVADCSQIRNNASERFIDTHWVSCEILVSGSAKDIDLTINTVRLSDDISLQEVLAKEFETINQRFPLREVAQNATFRFALALLLKNQDALNHLVTNWRPQSSELSKDGLRRAALEIANQSFVKKLSSDEQQRYLEQIGLKLSPQDLKRLIEDLPALSEKYEGVPTKAAVADFTVRRYTIVGKKSVVEVIQAVNQFVLERKKRLFVFAEPNYLTTLSHHASCVSPHSWGNGPYGAPEAITDGAFVPQDFDEQWALNTIDGYNTTTPINNRGKDVLVTIFDTSPFSITPDLLTSQPITWVKPAFDLHLFQPAVADFTPVSPVAGPSITTTIGVKEHGLFIAGLVHALSPESAIHLVRVMDDNGCGELALFAGQLYETILNPPSVGATERVFNLSMGVFCPSSCRERILPKSCLSEPTGEQCQTEIEEIVTLEIPTFLAKWLGIEIVASAGNDSAGPAAADSPPSPLPTPYPPERPAGYSYVLGVSASTQDKLRACYSNHGDFDDIAAPGGNGGLGSVSIVSSTLSSQCAPLAVTCATSSDPDCLKNNGVVSLISELPPVSSGYAYWSGTSFAAPFASGVTALCLANGRSSYDLLLNADTTSADQMWFGSGMLRIPEICR